ncbi:MAG TPA: response regulator [Methylomirabilota bacterium]|jgi:CheY-like chemotaxis protein|nr:response regulator [Methylomirabilota bacterium]
MAIQKRILVVDDDQISREGVAEVLSDEGYEVAVAADGHEAIALLASFHPDLVLTDLRMPGLDGVGVLQHIKHVSPATPVIIFTAHVLIDAQREAQRLGAQDYLNKPLDFDEMLRRVAKALTP